MRKNDLQSYSGLSPSIEQPKAASCILQQTGEQTTGEFSGGLGCIIAELHGNFEGFKASCHKQDSEIRSGHLPSQALRMASAFG